MFRKKIKKTISISFNFIALSLFLFLSAKNIGIPLGEYGHVF